MQQKTYQEITINDHGYQKFEDVDGADYCFLDTAGTIAQEDVAEWTRYVEYTIEEIVEATEVVEWGVPE